MKETSQQFSKEIPNVINSFSIFWNPDQFEWQTCGFLSKGISETSLVLIFQNKNSVHSEKTKNNTRDSFHYLINELIENAYKFHAKNTPVEVKIHILADSICTEIINFVNLDQKNKLKEFLDEINTNDRQILLVKRMENHANKELKNHTKSNIGILTLICDHSIIVEWAIESDKNDLFRVTMQSFLKIK